MGQTLIPESQGTPSRNRTLLDAADWSAREHALRLQSESRQRVVILRWEALSASIAYLAS
jgi:hypothetical protein